MQPESETIKGLLSQFLQQADRTQAPGDLDDLLDRFAKQIAGERTKLGLLPTG